MSLITVITPTYNREEYLQKLYKSLCGQTCRNFEWLIIDDGSQDHTEELVQSLINKSQFRIKYIKKSNGGKHTAINAGLKVTESILTMIVDSDDILLPNATSSIERIYKKYSTNKSIGSYTFLKVYSSGKTIVPLEDGELIANYINYRIKHNRPGDMAEVFMTDVLRSNPFPEFEDERFISEDVVWIEIGKKNDSLYINEAIYECEYLVNGLSSNDKFMKFTSPYGSMMRGKRLMSKECGMMANIKGAIIYNCYNFCVVNREIPSDLILSKREKFLTFLTKRIGMWFYYRWKK